MDEKLVDPNTNYPTSSYPHLANDRTNGTATIARGNAKPNTRTNGPTWRNKAMRILLSSLLLCALGHTQVVHAETVNVGIVDSGTYSSTKTT